MEVIKADNLTKIYKLDGGEVRAVDGISVAIRRGEFVSIHGPSGSGKSTLLHMLGLLDKPTGGDIYIEGAHVSGMRNGDVTRFRRKRLGFVFQQFNLIGNLNVYENAALPLVLEEIDEGERERRIMPLLKRLGMLHRMNNYPNQISGGEMQRTAIARALALNPDIIFADEPTGNLDSRSGEEVIKIFKELHKEGKTVIIITHDKNVAKNADRIIHIKDGKVEKTEVLK